MAGPQSIYPYGFTPAQDRAFAQKMAGYYSSAPFDAETFRALAEQIKRDVPAYVTLDDKSNKYSVHQADVEYDKNDMSLQANFEMLERRVLANRAAKAEAAKSAPKVEEEMIFAPKKFPLPQPSTYVQKYGPFEEIAPDVTRPNATYNRTSPLLKYRKADALLAEMAPKKEVTVAEVAVNMFPFFNSEELPEKFNSSLPKVAADVPPAAPSMYKAAEAGLPQAPKVKYSLPKIDKMSGKIAEAAPQNPEAPATDKAAPAAASDDAAKADNDKKSTSVKKGWKSTVKKIGKFALKVICFPAKVSYNAFVSLKNRVKKTKPVDDAKGPASDPSAPAA